MPSRFQLITELYDKTIRGITDSYSRWTGFLRAACYNYKCPFDEQILIYAQRPDATAVLEMDKWNRQFGRWVNRGAKSIAVFGDDGMKLYFDVSDTHETSLSRSLPIWTMHPDFESAVIEALENTFGDLAEKDSLVNAVRSAAHNAVADNLPDYLQDLFECREDSLLEELDALNLEVFYRDTLEVSVAYMLLTRLGYPADAYFSPDEFAHVYEFNTPSVINALGIATGDIAEMGLREISRTVMQAQREQFFANHEKSGYDRAAIENRPQNERSDEHGTYLSDAGRLSGAEPDAAAEGGSPSGQVRKAAEGISEEIQTGALYQPENHREADGTSGRNRADRSKAGGAERDTDGESRGRDGGAESRQSPSLDGSDEQLQAYSGGSSTERFHLRITAEEPITAGSEGLSAVHHIEDGFDDKQSYHTQARAAESAKERDTEPPASSELPPFLDMHLIEANLLDEGGRKHKRQEIFDYFQAHKNLAERTEFLKNSYNDIWVEVVTDGVRSGYHAEQDGLLMWEGSYLSRTSESVFSWAIVTEMTENLIERGEYKIKLGLQNLPAVAEQLTLFGMDAEESADAVSVAEPTEPLFPNRQVPQAVIDQVLYTAGNEYNSAYRVVAFYMREHPEQESIVFLKREFGTENGRGIAYEGHKYAVWFMEDGIHLAQGDSVRTGYRKTLVTWEQASARILELLEAGSYLSVGELERAQGKVLHDMADALLMTARDLTKEGREMGLFSQTLAILDRHKGYPELYEDVVAFAKTDGGLEILADEYHTFLKAHEQNRSVMRFRLSDYNTHRIGVVLDGLDLPKRHFTAQPDFLRQCKMFITQDEIDHYFLSGSTEEQLAVYSHFCYPHTPEEHQKFIKTLYGEYSGGGCAGYNHTKTSKGLEYTRDYSFKKYDTVHLTIPHVVREYEKLIAQKRFPGEDAIAKIPQYELHQLARSVYSGFYGAPEEMPHPYPKGADYYDAVSAMEQQLADRAKVAEILSVLTARLDGMSEDDRFYNFCKHAQKQLSEYADGTFSLFHHRHEGLTLRETTEPVEAAKQQENFTAETETVYPDEKNGLPYDVEIQALQDSEPEPQHSELRQPQTDMPPTPPYQVGDTVYLDDAAFEITEIGTHTIQLRDPTLLYPVFRGESKAQFEALLSQDGRNAFITEHLRQNDGMPQRKEAEPKQSQTDTLPVLTPPRKKNPVTLARPPAADGRNYRITDDHIGEGTPLERFQNNLNAIRLLKVIESEERTATAEEQSVLAQYVGWGGLADFFDEKNPRCGELKNLLTDEEYTAARESTLTAFYTPPVVIRSIYQVLAQMGFTQGNILEPACGIGSFFGLLPENMADSKLYGVELDDLSGRIARQLYQKSGIAVQGYEKTAFSDNFFDVAIGNVPFGQFKVPDKRYDRLNLPIHEYFIAKTLDQVRPGGVIAFVTSSFTMDKKTSNVRKYIAQRADLLGAIRLPNNAFKAAAGTEVVSDILFLQKRERMVATGLPPNRRFGGKRRNDGMDELSARAGSKEYGVRDDAPEWVHLATNDDGIQMNSYFIDHPDMVLGEMKLVSGPYGLTSTCEPYPDQTLENLLSVAVQNIHGEITTFAHEEELEGEEYSIEADPTVRNFSYTLVDNKIYYRENSRMNPVEVSKTAENRIRGMIELRDCVRTLLEYQTEDYPDEEIKAQQATLNQLYDGFTAKYGLLNSRGNAIAFDQDSSYFLLCSLEILDEEHNLKRKADLFTKRTIRSHQPAEKVDTAVEALALSIGEKACVDMAYMSRLTGKDEETLFSELQGVVFLNPEYMEGTNEKYLPADEYLSGNVRQKLIIAQTKAAQNPEYQINANALRQVQPVDLTASEISVRLGATWLETEYIRQFILETLDTPRNVRHKIKVHYSKITGEWRIEGKSNDKHNVKAVNTFGTKRVTAYEIIEDSLNLKDVRIFDYHYDEDGRRVAVLNKKETAIAQSKQEQIKEAFQEWIWKDPSRRESICNTYNILFNSNRPREYDGSHIHFFGMNPEITLRKHQVNAIAHILYGGNTLLAHTVGAGKTFEMVAAAMESKRLGLCQKSLFVVPNHLTEQWAAEFLQLYPAANILVATRKDFETKNRKKFCGRIATGDYDAIIIGHSQFEKIPVSVERQKAILERQMDDVLMGIREAKADKAENFTIKQMEKTKKGLQNKLDKLNDRSRKDDVVTFEELGVDRIFIDESHYFKNLFLYTKMRNVGGIAQTEAQKSSDLFMKCRYLDEITGGRGIIFATGTPISNSMVELYTIQRYLQMSSLEVQGLQHFDAWAANYGETVTAIELSPEGSGYRAKTRFAKFYNLPELMSEFKNVADIQTADMLNLPVPKANYHNIALKPSEYQKEMVAALSKRAEKVRNREVDSSEDNMLLITNDGRKLALDQRLVNPMLPDDPNSKAAKCAENVFEIWQRTAEKRSAQMIFCDLSTPKGDGTFSVYDDIRNKLIALGIPENEIAYIHNAKSESQKKDLFDKVRSGQVRVLLGSTQRMGAGTNCQQKLIALHHLDCPWRPSDLQQREGRIIRQGNENAAVDIYSYVTEGTFDAYLYQLVESKQKFISQIMTSKSPVRSAEDVDEQALSYAEIKALASGNPMIKEKMDLDIEVSKLKLLKANHLSQKYALEDAISKSFPREIADAQTRLIGYGKDISTVKAQTKPNADGFSPMTLAGRLYTEKKEAGAALLTLCQNMLSPEAVQIGSYRGLTLELSFESYSKEYRLTMIGQLRHTVTLGTDIFGNLQRMDNALEGLPLREQTCREQLSNLQAQLETAKAEVNKPFARDEELKTKTARLEELNVLLNLDEKTGTEIMDAEPDEKPRPRERQSSQMER